MKRSIMVLMGSVMITLGAMGAGPVVAAIQHASGVYPGAVQVNGGHISLPTASNERISETRTYQTLDALPVVLAWYSGQYQPMSGQHKANQCVILKKADGYGAFHQTVLVTLCPLANGTQIIFYRTDYLGS